jgi:hypothetical protein
LVKDCMVRGGLPPERFTIMSVSCTCIGVGYVRRLLPFNWGYGVAGSTEQHCNRQQECMKGKLLSLEDDSRHQCTDQHSNSAPPKHQAGLT